MADRGFERMGVVSMQSIGDDVIELETRFEDAVSEIGLPFISFHSHLNLNSLGATEKEIEKGNEVIRQ